MKILFVWTGLTSYMADCWRRLAAEPDVDLRVWIDDSSAAARAVAFDASHVMRNLAWERVGVKDWKGRPDIIFAVGWRSAVCRSIVTYGPWADIPKVCCFDMPWRWKLRCLVAPLALGRFLRNYDAAFVPGECCARYAKWLGFKSIHKGLFAIETERFRCSTSNLNPSPSTLHPQPSTYLLYIGRNSSEKRLDDIRAAHRLYREQGGKLELRMYGKDLPDGFLAPEQVPAVMQGAAAFVLASDFDPWPLVLLEAMSAGCPIIASDRCTNRPELGKNWRVFPVGDVKALANEMLACEHGGASVDECKENLDLARQYDCAEWVKRVKQIIEEVAC